MFRSIKTRLTITICGVLLLVFAVQMAANLLFAEKFYVYQKEKLLKEVYEEMKELAAESGSTIDSIMTSLDIDNNLEVVLADDNKQIAYSNRPQDMKPGWKAEEVIEGELLSSNHLTANNSGNDTTSGNTKGQNAIDGSPQERNFNLNFLSYPEAYFNSSNPTILKPAGNEGGRLQLLSKLEIAGVKYYLAIQLPVKFFNREMSSANMFIFYISSFAIVAGGLTVYFLAKQFAKPIEEINKVAIHVSNLDFSTRTKKSKRKDEIGSLASNINIMADRLEENIVNLQDANKKLEYDNEYMNMIDEQRKELIANISHELKTPLAIIGGYAEMLGNDIPGIDKSFYYETIQDETSKMDIMIKNLLNMSNMENKLNEINEEEVDLVQMTDWIFRKNSVLINNSKILSDFKAEPCSKVMADPLYIEEAINNYISNAIRYTEPGHWLKLRVYQKAEEVVVSVFNEGVNIDEVHLEKIWNSFYREDKSRRRTSQNNIGLGLYIVRSIMNAHHGKCGVVNKENGVEFWLSLKAISSDVKPVTE